MLQLPQKCTKAIQVAPFQNLKAHVVADFLLLEAHVLLLWQFFSPLYDQPKSEMHGSQDLPTSAWSWQI